MSDSRPKACNQAEVSLRIGGNLRLTGQRDERGKFTNFDALLLSSVMKIGEIDLGVRPVVLAPMEDITDSPFRQLCRHFGADMVFTEFISSEGLIRDAVKSTGKMCFSNQERPVGVQIFGHDMDSMKRAVEKAEEVSPDLVDINWGCPVRKVISKGAGAGMLRDMGKMAVITSAIVKTTKLPVTVKTRVGWDDRSKNILDIALRLQDTGIKAITIHGRTKEQLYSGKADWNLIAEVKNDSRIHIPVIGNGDVDTAEKALAVFNKYQVDGIMVGRAAIGNPWLFREIRHLLMTGRMIPPPDLDERIAICRHHVKKAVMMKGERRGVVEMRKHFARYFRYCENFKPVKALLMEAVELSAVDSILQGIPSLTGRQQDG
jgi:nifR3 family TIM-barrel protein